MLLKAISKPSIRDKVAVHIAGDGPEMENWKRMAMDLGFNGQCIWHGWLTQEKTSNLLNDCDVLAFTSVLEATSATVMQSLSLGVPVICLKRCGFGDVIDSENGISIKFESKAQAIECFAQAIESIIINPEKLERLSQKALNTASIYSWDNLANKISDCYESVMTLK